jgi:glycosyltransferase involved in cell wall biosynthesis
LLGFKTFGLKFDVLHILYGEDYYRFSRMLFPFKKIVVTFHQPPAILRQELDKGNYNGRVAGFTHTLMRGRIKKLDAAIVMTDEQKEVAKEFIPIEKIHVIPLGVELSELNQKFLNAGNTQRKVNQFITVGEWQRDWELYLRTVAFAKEKFPHLKFILINKNINEELKLEISKYSNVEYKNDISNEELFALYLESFAMFLPLKSAAGNNALNEGLSLGCMVLSNLKFKHLKNSEKFVFNFENNDEFGVTYERLSLLSNNERHNISLASNEAMQEYSWENVSKKLSDLYEKL